MNHSPCRFGACLVVACLFSPCFADEREVIEKAGMYLSRVATDQTPGVAVLFGRNGKILYQGGSGMANLSPKTPITAETKFRIGSISKQFTAAAVLLLAEQNKLSLEDPLTKYYPNFPNSDGVLLHHLLTHTSGLHSYTEKSDFYIRVTEHVDPAKIIDWFKNDPADFPPGTGFHYCNTGYFLLGEIISKVSGKSLAAFLDETFFVPLEMSNTGFYVNAKVPENMASGYSWNEGKYDVALEWEKLERFVGKYQYGPAVMTVSREGTQLYAQLTGQPNFPIFPKSESTFEWRVVEAKVEFVMDEQSAVTVARHTQNGTTFDAPKTE